MTDGATPRIERATGFKNDSRSRESNARSPIGMFSTRVSENTWTRDRETLAAR